VEPYFNETLSSIPSLLPGDQQAELQTLAIASCKALGLRTGVFHVEAKYTSRGARIIEVNCRMGGGSVYFTNRLVYGVDLAIEQLILSCGGKPLPKVERYEPFCCLAQYSLPSLRSGIISNVDFLAAWKDHPRMVYADLMVHTGQHIVGPDSGMPTWLCDIMCVASTVEKSIQFLKDIETNMPCPVVDQLP
jgi:carnosine synthase